MFTNLCILCREDFLDHLWVGNYDSWRMEHLQDAQGCILTLDSILDHLTENEPGLLDLGPLCISDQPWEMAHNRITLGQQGYALSHIVSLE